MLTVLALPAPQVGMMRRIFICLDDRNRPEDAPRRLQKILFIEFINPEIEYLSDETAELYEGCLSFPGHNGAITRSKRSRSRHRTATATGLNWKPKTCWPAASSTRTTT